MLDLDPADVVECGNADPELRLRARHFTGVLRLHRDAESWDVVFDSGRLSSCGPSNVIATATLSYAASTEIWDELLSAKPPPFRVDAANSRYAGASLDGDVYEALGPCYPLLQRMLGLLRELRSGVLSVELGDYLDWETQTCVGRYVPIETDGVRYRVYVEEAGAGIPLLLQHTAGADARQWRHVLADPEITRDFRVIAYDLPFHGLSLPPDDNPWWEQPYLPTKSQLMAWVVALAESLGLERPVFLGCSVGGHLAADLMAHHGERFRAAISVNGWYHQGPFGHFDNSRFTDPRITDEYSAAISYGSTTPHGPERLRREAPWIYGSNQHGAYAGDNEYFMTGHDLREDGHLIDTDRTPLYVVVGEYDPAIAFPEAGAAALVEHVAGSRLVVAENMGHFMMVDNPVGFRDVLRPLLREIRDQETTR